MNADKEALFKLAEYCDLNGLDMDVIRSRGRRMRVVIPRHAAMKHLRNLGFSFPVIGRVFRRDHSTVVYAVYGK